MHCLIDCGLWLPSYDGDPAAFGIFKRHYSYVPYADGRRDDPAYRNRFQFVGPGHKVVLMTPAMDALWAWRKFIDDSGQQGVNCAVFRNEGPYRASDLILEAEVIGRKHWPCERFYAYVNPAKVKGTCPGYCFRRAGWKHEGFTKGGLMIFAKVLDSISARQ